MASLGVITRRAYARIGLLGNPSDGFFGKTIAVSLQNFYAEVGWNLGQEEKPWSGLGAIAMLFRWMSAAHALRCDARPTPASGFIYRQLRVFEPPGFVGLRGELRSRSHRRTRSVSRRIRNTTWPSWTPFSTWLTGSPPRAITVRSRQGGWGLFSRDEPLSLTPSSRAAGYTPDGCVPTTGGVRLLQALCVKFHAFCSHKGVALAAQPFTLKYDTNIPKQAGLSGSSAIICAALKVRRRRAFPTPFQV